MSVAELMIGRKTSCFFVAMFMSALALVAHPLLALGWPAKQSSGAEHTRNDMRKRIDTLIRQTVKEGNFRTADGVAFNMEVPPSMAVIKEIQSYGEKALPILEEYVWGKGNREAVVALRLIGQVGGANLVKTLGPVVERHPSPQLRIRALRWLSRGPKKEILPIIRKAADSDPDESVRRVAKEILALD
ncbi:MAG: HEAT repeat domain-containing protein [Acidobacteria bacterium]|nr:HEAT repeat domain-containing protein [Acidobacteriota bacterium]